MNDIDRNITKKLSIKNPVIIKLLEKIYNPKNVEEEIRRVTEIDKENMDLLKRLNAIYRGKSKVDCWRDHVITESKFVDFQLKEYQQINKENEEIFQRLQEILAKKRINEKYKSRKKKKKESLKEPLTKMLTLKKRAKDIRYCFFELKIPELQQNLGKIIIQLFTDIVPRTCRNFAAFCSGFQGLSYENTPFHLIISNYLCQGGDVVKFNGTGGTSIYGDDFQDENFNLTHNSPGILSMANTGPNTNNSKFNIIFKPLEILDGKSVVFGKVVGGVDIFKIEAFGSKIGKPKQKIIISKCGKLC